MKSSENFAKCYIMYQKVEIYYEIITTVVISIYFQKTFLYPSSVEAYCKAMRWKSHTNASTKELIRIENI